ncbi:HlyD family efflux transporter periplasmic adaptor subunit [Bradyrhizobium sp. 143]|nr:HlyD family efflux transporter periplasmic adaptor subunit [Bradyrhizobium sp. 142]MCK1712233.1 HlyD family efflux transporter periplasmic adaptor subunit [Bradyrhizobium sp. 143]MCK1724867.1 HlyD family efflux transporter periplasmic adaptor subunit [Bradyrhizobium sp. 142]
MHIERFIRSRIVRRSLALGIIALSGWALLPYVTYRIAPSAFVNAELMRVTAPFAGQLSPDLPRKGEYFQRTRLVPLVETHSPDRRHLMDLDQQLAVSTKRAELARRQLDEIAELDRKLRERSEDYRSGVVARLSHEIGETEAEKGGCLAEARQRNDVAGRMERLVKLGISSQIRSAEAQASQEATATRCQMAEERLQRLKTELESAEKGIYLRGDANDVPSSQQQRERLVLRRQELETDLLQNCSRSAQLATEIAEERARLERLGHYDLSLPAAHVVWSVAASPGSMVIEGQSVFDFADCEHRFIVAELPERDFEKIKAGDAAAVRLLGSREWKTGQVRQTRGSAAYADDRLLAARVPRPDPGSITVEISLPRDETSADRSGFCDIGRQAEVRFERPATGLLQLISGQLKWLTAGLALDQPFL